MKLLRPIPRLRLLRHPTRTPLSRLKRRLTTPRRRPMRLLLKPKNQAAKMLHQTKVRKQWQLM